MREVKPWIGVTGSSGRLGRLVVSELARRAPVPVVALSRRAPRQVPAGVTWRPLDYDDQESAPESLRGVGTLLLIASNAPDPVRGPQHRRVIEAAAASGATRLAYTSLTGIDTRDSPIDALHRDTEQALRASGVPWVSLRNAEYTENWTASAFEHAQAGAVSMDLDPATSIASATRADLAAATAAVLLTTDLACPVVDLAGSRAWTPVDFAAALSRVAGRNLVYRQHSRARQREAWIARGLPGHVVDLMADVHRNADAGSFSRPGTRLATALGRPVQDLHQALADAMYDAGVPPFPPGERAERRGTPDRR